jgi:signal transduction histidine kinase
MRFGDTGRLNKEQLELLEQLHQTNERLTKMVQNLQDAIKIDQRRLALRIEDLAVEDVIDEVAGLLAVPSRKKGLALHWNRPKVPMPRAYADRQYLEKALANLVGNAVKYTPQNGHIEIDIEETNEASPGGRKGKFLKVTVEDNGMGIPKDEVERTFSRFFRASNVMGSEIEGTGLGLYLTKQIVELHGGQIWLESREGIGTKVAFTLSTEKPNGKGSAIKQA